MLIIPRGTGFVEARRLIDEEHPDCEKPIVQLRRQNTLTLIAKIPDEILIEIFVKLKDEPESASWHYVTYVCWHWRWVAVQARRLWTDPPTHRHNLTLLFLERSMPLDLEIYFTYRTSRETVIAISRSKRHVRTLSIDQVNHGPLLNEMQELLLSLGQDGSALKALYISLHQSRGNKFKLSASTFGRPLLLQKLSLQFIEFDWKILPLSNLTTLSLEYIIISSRVPWETFCSTLAAMPRLARLRLDFAALELHSLSSTSSPVRLSYLATLHISCATEAEILSFLSTFIMRSLEQADMICTHKSHDDHAAAIGAISRMIERGNFGTLDELRLFEDYFSLLSECPGKHLTFSHPGRLTGDAAIQFVVDLLSGISAGWSSILTRVTLGSFPAPSSAKIVEIFAEIPLLRSMTVMEEMAIPFLDGLNIPTSDMVDTQLPFPALRSVVFRREYEGTDEDTVFRDEVLGILCESIMQRRDYNVPIISLTIPWTITEQQLDCLKEIVAHVAFDGCGGIAV